MADRLEQIGREITSRVEKLDKLGTKAVDQVDSIGQLLAEAEKLCDTPEAFEAFKQKHCPDLGRSRTYELLAVKEGRKSLEDIRASTKARVAKHRAGTKAVTDNSSVTAIAGPRNSADEHQAAGESDNQAEAGTELDDPLVIKTGNERYDVEASPGFDSKIRPIFQGAIKNDPDKSASAFARFKHACATSLGQMTIKDLQAAQAILMVVGYVESDIEEQISAAKEAAAKAKRIKWEAKNPEKAKEKARGEEQEEAMADDNEEAKAEARQNDEVWSDVKDEWIEEWIANNWGDEEEGEFEVQFQCQWKEDHGEHHSTHEAAQEVIRNAWNAKQERIIARRAAP
jgi:hypothetical protein